MDSDSSNKESVDGEKVGKDPNGVDKGAVADEEMGSPSCLPHVQAVDVLLGGKLLGIVFVRQFFTAQMRDILQGPKDFAANMNLTCKVTRAVRIKLRSKVTVAIPNCRPRLASRPNLVDH